MNIKVYKYSALTKIILFFTIILAILFIFVLGKNKDSGINEKWVSKSEFQENINLNTNDDAYIYCSSYEDIKKDNTKTQVVVFILGFSIIMLTAIVLFLIEKLHNKRIKEKKKDLNIVNKIKNDSIANKFITNESELNYQEILNNEFKNTVYNMFCELQIACMNFDYKKLSNLLTPKLYDNYCKGLDSLKTKSRKNIVSEIEFVDIKFVESKEDLNKYSIKVHLEVKFYGYMKDIKNNEIIKGSKNEKISNTYMLNIVKYKQSIDNNCYNCGAPLENDSTICQYCKTENINKLSNWIISEKEKLN